MSDENREFAALRAAIARAQEKRNAPLAEGEVRAYQAVEEFFEDEDWRALQRVVLAVRRSQLRIFNLYLGEQRLGSAIVDEVLEHEPDNFGTLVQRLEDRAADEGPWLVATPIANADQGSEFIQLADEAFLLRPEQDREWEPWGGAADPAFELQRMIRDRISPRPRWLRTGLLPHPLDTRHGSCLVTVERGSAAAALAAARTRARYALATWTLHKVPSRREIWPALGVWSPQPFLDTGQGHKPYEPDIRMGRSTTTSRTIHTKPYELPEDQSLLQLPFRAIAAVSTSHGAQALLSSTYALFQGTRFPQDQELTDRLFWLFTAVASLCEVSGALGAREMLARWTTLRKRFALWEELHQYGYRDEDLRAAEQRLTDVRNITAHGADSVLVNLGYPANKTRDFRGGRSAQGEQLALAVLFGEFRPMQWAVRKALRHAWDIVSADEFDDRAFDGLFVETT